MSSFVLDNSVTMRWCFEEDSHYAMKVLQDVRSGQTAYVPPLWLYEVISVMAASQRKSLLTPKRGQEFIEDLRSLPIQIDAPVDRESILGNAYHLAVHHGLTGYDAIYLELAIRKGLPLASLDDELNQAALKEGVQLVQP